MMLFAGVDGGQSSTVVAVGDGERELARAVGPPADLVGEPRDSPRQSAAIRSTLAAALAKAGRDAARPVEALVAGISGFDRGEAPALDLSAVAVRSAVVHDTEIALAGALGGRDGIVVIAGTGSVAIGRAAGTTVRAGGWGYFFGDEGSALWIAREALACAMRRSDRAEPSELAERARAFYGAFTLRTIQHAFAHGELTRPQLAAFAADVAALADEGDPDARAIRTAACRELAALVATLDRRLRATEARSVSYAGGLFAQDPFTVAFAAAVGRAVPAAAVVVPQSDPAGGALLLARRLA